MQGIEPDAEDRTQRIYARLAGFLFLWLIINGVAGTVILSRIAGKGTFAEVAERIAASERLYRVGLATAVIETLSTVLLFFALYVTLKRVNSVLAELALIFSLLDSVLGALVRMCGFVKLHLYTSTQTARAGTVMAEALRDLLSNIADATENIGGILFGIGSLLFFYLFFKSKYLPRLLSGLGLAASTIWIGLYFASLVFPALHTVFQYICFPPMALAELITGFWLMLFTVVQNDRGEED